MTEDDDTTTGCTTAVPQDLGNDGSVRTKEVMDLLAPSRSVTGIRAVWRTADVAEFWQRSPQTIWKWIRDGRHPDARHDPGGRPYWDPAEVLAFAYDGAPVQQTDESPNACDESDDTPLSVTIGSKRDKDAPAADPVVAPVPAGGEPSGLRLVIGGEVVA